MVIIGARGLARELLAVLQWNGETNNLLFFDNVNVDSPGFMYGQFPILKSWQVLEEHLLTKSPEFVLGVGGAETRKILTEKIVSMGGKPCSIISKHALVGEFGNEIGNGVCVLSHATITGDANIGDGALINKAVIISHDAKVGQYCEISPGAKILGRTIIGDQTEIGANAVVLPDVIVGSDCKVGAGAVVTKNVPDGYTVVGIPAKPVKK